MNMAYLPQHRFDFRQLRHCDVAEYAEIIDFVMQSRRALFPMLSHQQLPDDLAHFSDYFIDSDLGCFIRVREQEGQLVAVIGFKAYDFRFSQLDLPSHQNIVEIVKLYVAPQFRRQYLAQDLVAKMKVYAHQQHVDGLYLHTHPFLDGALTFWQKQGFELLCQDSDPIWQTLHLFSRL